MSSTTAVKYQVFFRDSTANDIGFMFVWALKVEGWRNDYAFFGDASDLDKVTCLIPRETVLVVEMVDQEAVRG